MSIIESAQTTLEQTFVGNQIIESLKVGKMGEKMNLKCSDGETRKIKMLIKKKKVFWCFVF